MTGFLSLVQSDRSCGVARFLLNIDSFFITISNFTSRDKWERDQNTVASTINMHISIIFWQTRVPLACILWLWTREEAWQAWCVHRVAPRKLFPLLDLFGCTLARIIVPWVRTRMHSRHTASQPTNRWAGKRPCPAKPSLCQNRITGCIKGEGVGALTFNDVQGQGEVRYMWGRWTSIWRDWTRFHVLARLAWHGVWLRLTFGWAGFWFVWTFRRAILSTQ